MDELADAGRENVDVDAFTPSPCCCEPVTLRSLIYDWPVGFARFTVDVWNPSRGPRTPIRTSRQPLSATPLGFLYADSGRTTKHRVGPN